MSGGLHVLPFVVVEQIQAGAAEMNVVLGDLVAQQAPRAGVVLAGHRETACKIAQP